jgi:hypothetical protein
MLDRQGAGVDLLPGVLRQAGRRALPQVLEGAPQPAHAAVELALVRQAGEQGVRFALTPHLGQEAGLAGAGQQVPHQGDGEHLRVRAGRGRARAPRDRHLPGGQLVVDPDVGMEQQVRER